MLIHGSLCLFVCTPAEAVSHKKHKKYVLVCLSVHIFVTMLYKTNVWVMICVHVCLLYGTALVGVPAFVLIFMSESLWAWLS